MQESLDKEVQAHNFLQHLKIEHEEKIEKLTSRVNVLTTENGKLSEKFNRLTGLNEEMRELIT